MNFEDIEKEMNEYVNVLDEIAENNQYSLVALYVTDIINKGSYVLYNKKAQNLMETAYDLDKIEQGHYFENCVSRKKDVVPVIMEVFQ